jgi:hypothetical protein
MKRPGFMPGLFFLKKTIFGKHLTDMDKARKLLSESPYARWGVLLLLGLTLSVNYYFYDAFSSLKPLLTKEFAFTNTQYGLFVSF